MFKKINLINFLLFVVAMIVTSCQVMSRDYNYDNSGNVKVDQKVENTYRLPDLSAGFYWDNKTGQVRNIITVEVKDDIYSEFYPINEYPVKLDFGLGDNLSVLTANLRLTSIIEVSGGFGYGYDYEKKEPVVGINVLITKF